jgi:hypothetical protein
MMFCGQATKDDRLSHQSALDFRGAKLQRHVVMFLDRPRKTIGYLTKALWTFVERNYDGLS